MRSFEIDYDNAYTSRFIFYELWPNCIVLDKWRWPNTSALLEAWGLA